MCVSVRSAKVKRRMDRSFIWLFFFGSFVTLTEGPFALLTERPFTSFTEGPFVTLTVRPFLSRIRSNDFFASLTEGSMSLSACRAVSQRSGLSARRAVSQRSGLSAQRSILIVGSCGCGVQRDEDSYPPRPCISQQQYRLGWSFYIRPPLPAT